MTARQWLAFEGPFDPDPGRAEDELDEAAAIIGAAFRVASTVIEARAAAPGTFPAYGPTPHTAEQVARRALAELLEAGWTPPGRKSP